MTKPTAVVWIAPGSPAPGELLSALDRGGLLVEYVTSPYLALAHLCRLERACPGQGKVANGALVLVNPPQLPGAGEVCEAAEHYAPGTKAWMYGGGTGQRLRGVMRSDIESWMKGSVIEPKPRRVKQTGEAARVVRPSPLRSGGNGPNLRLAGDLAVQEGAPPVDSEVNTGDEGASANRPRSVLTSEELDMLLNDGEPGA